MALLIALGGAFFAGQATAHSGGLAKDGCHKLNVKIDGKKHVVERHWKLDPADAGGKKRVRGGPCIKRDGETYRLRKHALCADERIAMLAGAGAIRRRLQAHRPRLQAVRGRHGRPGSRGQIPGADPVFVLKTILMCYALAGAPGECSLHKPDEERQFVTLAECRDTGRLASRVLAQESGHPQGTEWKAEITCERRGRSA